MQLGIEGEGQRFPLGGYDLADLQISRGGIDGVEEQIVGSLVRQVEP